LTERPPIPGGRRNAAGRAGGAPERAEALDEADDDYLLTVDEVAADLGIDLDE